MEENTQSRKGKLEIGPGMRHHPGYFTVDVEGKYNPDILGDFRDMVFSDLEEVRSHHVLEHFSRDEAIGVLKLWHSWLKPGGTLRVETPDFEEICANFQKDKYWMARHAYGSQEADWAFHRSGWWEDRFKEILPKQGFRIISIRKSNSRKILPNIEVIAEKNDTPAERA